MLQHQDLRDQLASVGYFPDVLAEVIDGALAGQTATAFYVHPDVAFGHGTIGRHLSVLVLTATRLIVVHADDHAPDEFGPAALAASAEAIPISRVRAVATSRIFADPAAYVPGDTPRVIRLSISWGETQTVEIEPAGCADPDCVADHGYAGSLTGEDITLSVTTEVAGDDAARQLDAFARRLSFATAV
ncbi:MAG: DUF5998 family protein [Bifidobacteriaceae bacterium]|jgi:hypothetical protein|nr:DUF5998 family protein [Bifidobacteriaceae bacterium]